MILKRLLLIVHFLEVKMKFLVTRAGAAHFLPRSGVGYGTSDVPSRQKSGGSATLLLIKPVFTICGDGAGSSGAAGAALVGGKQPPQ